MNSSVLYLGAGASANALPTTATMNERLEFQIKHIKEFYEIIRITRNFEPTYYLENISWYIKELEFLKDVCSLGISVDAAALMRAMKGQMNDYNRIKKAWTMFFLYEEAIYQLDPRYTYWTCLKAINSKFSFWERDDKHKTIISWNVDNQFEMAHLQVFGNKSDLIVLDEFNVTRIINESVPLEVSVKTLEEKLEFIKNENPNKCILIKLNGSASFRPSQITKATGKLNMILNYNGFHGNKITRRERHLRTDIKEYVPIDVIGNDSNYSWQRVFGDLDEIIKMLRTDDISESRLRFSWDYIDFIEKETESPDTKMNILDVARYFLRNSDEISTFGYSFPAFNELIDRALLSELPLTAKVNVYCVDGSSDIENIGKIKNWINKDERVAISVEQKNAIHSLPF